QSPELLGRGPEYRLPGSRLPDGARNKLGLDRKSYRTRARTDALQAPAGMPRILPRSRRRSVPGARALPGLARRHSGPGVQLAVGAASATVEMELTWFRRLRPVRGVAQGGVTRRVHPRRELTLGSRPTPGRLGGRESRRVRCGGE